MILVEPAVTEEDFKGVILVENRAFGPSPLTNLVFGGSSPSGIEDLPGGFPGRLVPRLEQMRREAKAQPTIRLTKATDTDTGKIVGFGCWHFLLDPDNFVEPIKADPSPTAKSPEFARSFFQTLIDSRQKFMNGKKHLFMFVLAVDPDCQRRGIGQKLLDWGLEQADEMQIPCWIDASKYGLGLYKKNNWVEVAQHSWDLAQWGGPEETDTVVHLVREPQRR